MSHSNSSLNCFTSCMKKYELNYINHFQPDKISPHLVFGQMAHEVLEKAGRLRDEVEDGVVDREAYYPVIPSEVLYPELKEYFGISNWQTYFLPIIQETANYEEFWKNGIGNSIVEREVKLQITPADAFKKYNAYSITQPVVGVVDLLIYNQERTAAVILDYKFSSKRKTQDNFDHDSQLYLYAALVNHTYGIPFNNMHIGYIDIPKESFEKPIVLKNGTLSRSKSQNVSGELYKKAVIAVHGNDPYYNCDAGGYYEDVYNELKNNKAAYMNTRYLDVDTMTHVLDDLFTTAKLIDLMTRNNLPFCRRYDSYSCASCEYLSHCKPWLGLKEEE